MRAVALAVAGASALLVESCRASYHPLLVAEACHCSPREYCRVRGGGAVACLPLPDRCSSSPSCSCLGRAVDACREELGAFTVLEPRPVPACDECSSEEYCWRPDGPGGGSLCGVIPARCEETPTCDCFTEARHFMGPLACTVREGRIEASPAREQAR